MPVQVGPWHDPQGGRKGELVRLVVKDGVRYKQFRKDKKESNLIPLEVEPESDSEDDAEEEGPPDPTLSGNQPISQPRTIVNRHGSAEYSSTVQNPPLPAQSRPDRHYALSVDPHGTLDTPRDRTGRPTIPSHLGGQRNEALHGASRDRHVASVGVNVPIVGPGQSTEPAAGFVSELSNLSHDFAEIEKADYLAVKNFMLEHPGIVRVEYKQELLHDAGRALKRGLNRYPESCVERAVVIDECLGLTARGMREYLDDLVGSSRNQQEFQRRCTQTLEGLMERPAPRPSEPVAAVSSATGPPTYARHGYVGKDHTTTLFPSGARERDHRSSTSDPQATLPTFSSLAVSNTTRHSVAPPQAPRRNTTGSPAVVHQASGRHNDEARQVTTNASDPLKPRGQLQTLPSANGEFDFKGTDGDEEKLDSRYRKRRDARTFFCEGRVFAMLWHENAGPDDKPSSDVRFVTKGRFGSRIFTHKRRMVVVRQREGYCCCLGINSYGGNGISKKGLKPSEQQAHAIIHMSTVKPVKIANEAAMTKEPIAVVMAPGQELNSQSRLHYGAPNTVQWNVKVMNVGKVHKDSMAFLMSSWRNEMGFD